MEQIGKNIARNIDIIPSRRYIEQQNEFRQERSRHYAEHRAALQKMAILHPPKELKKVNITKAPTEKALSKCTAKVKEIVTLEGIFIMT